MKIIIPIIIGIIVAIGIGIYASSDMESSDSQIIEEVLEDETEIIGKSYNLELSESINFKEP